MMEYPTYNNNGAVTPLWAMLLTLASIGMTGNVYYGWLHIPYWVALAPVGYVIGSMLLFRLFVNAFHRALYYDGMDCYAHEQQAQAEAMQAAVEFSAEDMLASLREDELARA